MANHGKTYKFSCLDASELVKLVLPFCTHADWLDYGELGQHIDSLSKVSHGLVSPFTGSLFRPLNPFRKPPDVYGVYCKCLL